MNRGRNIAVILLCLVSFSLLAFLTGLNRNSTSGVVDNVRYYLTDSHDDVRSYDLYFIERDKMSCVVSKMSDSLYLVLIDGYPYSYSLSGNAAAGAEITERAETSNPASDPYGLFRKEFLLSMVYGSKPVLSVTQAIIVAAVAALGGVVLWKQEELWGFFNKDKEKEYPEISDLKKFKLLGGIMIAAAVILLLVFVII